MIVSAVMCGPKVGHPWEFTVAAKCVRISIIAVILGIVNSALDLFLLILPIPVILPMQLSVRKKIGILAIFMVGSW